MSKKKSKLLNSGGGSSSGGPTLVTKPPTFPAAIQLHQQQKLHCEDDRKRAIKRLAHSIDALIASSSCSTDGSARSKGGRAPENVASSPSEEEQQLQPKRARKSPPPSVSGPFCDALQGVKITLLDDELWARFFALNTEMIITKSGRRMFPTVKVAVHGVKPSSPFKYFLLLDVVPMDDERYRYIYSDSMWKSAGKAEPPPRSRLYSHPDGPFTFEQLEKQKNVVAFDKAKLTNNELDCAGHLILNSMHKYQPRVHVVARALDDDRPPPTDTASLRADFHSTFVFPVTQFISVTAYQNQLITKLKIDKNPFAKGFREAAAGRSPDFDIQLAAAAAAAAEMKASTNQLNNMQHPTVPGILQQIYMRLMSGNVEDNQNQDAFPAPPILAMLAQLSGGPQNNGTGNSEKSEAPATDDEEEDDAERKNRKAEEKEEDDDTDSRREQQRQNQAPTSMWPSATILHQYFLRLAALNSSSTSGVGAPQQPPPLILAAPALLASMSAAATVAEGNGRNLSASSPPKLDRCLEDGEEDDGQSTTAPGSPVTTDEKSRRDLEPPEKSPEQGEKSAEGEVENRLVDRSSSSSSSSPHSSVGA